MIDLNDQMKVMKLQKIACSWAKTRTKTGTHRNNIRGCVKSYKNVANST